MHGLPVSGFRPNDTRQAFRFVVENWGQTTVSQIDSIYCGSLPAVKTAGFPCPAAGVL